MAFRIISNGRFDEDLSNICYKVTLILLFIGILFSHPVVSICIISLAVNWLISGRIVQKTKIFLSSPPAVLMVLFYLFHAIGMLWTEDFDYALKDLRIKLPFLALPVILSSIDWKKIGSFRLFIGFFCAAVFVGTLISTVVYLGWFIQVEDVRDISLFISHIRFGLMIALAALILLYAAARKDYVPKIRLLLLFVGLWLVTFLFILNSLSGVVVLFIAGYAILIHSEVKRKIVQRKWRIGSILLLIPILFGSYFYTHLKEFYTIEEADWTILDKQTPYGAEYRYEWGNKSKENGNYVKYYIAEKEMEQAWNERSEIAYYDPTNDGGVVYEVLQRFLTSKGLRKDRDGVAALTEEEIKAVQNGVANIRYMDGLSVDDRIYQAIWEIDNYVNGLNPEGNSVGMRFVFWKTGIQVFKKSPWLGVGTGDIKNAFADMYEENNSTLGEKYRMRGHNQYITTSAQLGIVGLIIFVLMFVSPFFTNPNSRKSIFIAFWIIATFSMINEDTIETQIGATFVSLFFCFLLYCGRNYSPKTS